MKDYRILLLDADDTLFDFDACEREALHLAFRKYNYPINEAIRRQYHEINKDLWKRYEYGEIDRNTVLYTRFGKLFSQLGIDDDGIVFEDDYQELLGKQHFFIDGALELLRYLQGKYDMYIVTNGVTITQYQRLRASGTDKYVKGIFVSEETGSQKPQLEYFNYCFQRIEGMNKSKTLIIGDSLSSDIRGGNNAGIDTCWYNPKSHPNNTEARVDYEIKSLDELYKLL